MRIIVKLFAVLRDAAGVSELSLDVPPGTSAGGAVDMLIAQYPPLRAHAGRAAVAVNLAYAARSVLLHEGDELALIPPVSGGYKDV